MRCVANFNDLTKEEVEDVFALQNKLRKSLQKTFKAKGFNYAWNEGELAGQVVPHFHLHILPRKKGDTGIMQYDPREFLYRPGSREKSSDRKLIVVATKIKKHL